MDIENVTESRKILIKKPGQSGFLLIVQQRFFLKEVFKLLFSEHYINHREYNAFILFVKFLNEPYLLACGLLSILN